MLIKYFKYKDTCILFKNENDIEYDIYFGNKILLSTFELLNQSFENNESEEYYYDKYYSSYKIIIPFNKELFKESLNYIYNLLFKKEIIFNNELLIILNYLLLDKKYINN